MRQNKTELKRNLLKIYDQINHQHARSVCFTASGAQEGTTTIATAFAKAVASLGKKIIYCDFCDYETSFSKTLNKTFIEGKGKIEQQFQKNIVFLEEDNFYLIPPPPMDFLHTLNNEKLELLLEELKKDYELVIIDTNYFRHYSTEPFYTNNLCQHTDGTILIVLSSVSVSEKIKDVIEKMKFNGINILGIVMNDKEFPDIEAELLKSSHKLDTYFPKTAEKFRHWLETSPLFKIEL